MTTDTRVPRRTQNRPDTRWTDRCFVIGPNLRWVQDDYDDLYKAHPEVFLGLTTWLLTPDMIRHGRARGVGHPAKIILLHGLEGHRPAWHRHFRMEIAMWRAMGSKIERWYVHRGYGIWKMDVFGARMGD